MFASLSLSLPPFQEGLLGKPGSFLLGSRRCGRGPLASGERCCSSAASRGGMPLSSRSPMLSTARGGRGRGKRMLPALLASPSPLARSRPGWQRWMRGCCRIPALPWGRREGGGAASSPRSRSTLLSPAGSQDPAGSSCASRASPGSDVSSPQVLSLREQPLHRAPAEPN